MRIRLVHNGYKVEFPDTMEEVEAYMQNVITQHLNLQPTKIIDRELKGGKNIGADQVRIVVYRYNTLYEENFMIYKSMNNRI